MKSLFLTIMKNSTLILTIVLAVNFQIIYTLVGIILYSILESVEKIEEKWN